MDQDVSSGCDFPGRKRYPSRRCWRSPIDAYTWITHHVFANAQTANMLVLWIHAMAREWAKALHYVPFLTAFVLGVIMASWLRRLAGANAGPINLFPAVEFWAYSSVMPTTNLRQTIEGFLIAVTGSLDPHHFRRSGVFAMILAAFGTGAATGAYVTVQVPALTLNILVTFL